MIPEPVLQFFQAASWFKAKSWKYYFKARSLKIYKKNWDLLFKNKKNNRFKVFIPEANSKYLNTKENKKNIEYIEKCPSNDNQLKALQIDTT